MQKCLEESSPFLPEARQGVRRRIQRPSVSARLEVQNPEESIWARALGRFQVILQSLQQRCWDALTWLREKAAPWLKEKATAFLEAICSAVRAVWGVLMDFCRRLFEGQGMMSNSIPNQRECRVRCCLMP